MIQTKQFVFIVLSIFTFHVNDSIGECPKIISRKQWGAKSNREVDYMIIPVKYVIIQHTVTPECKKLTECVDRVFNIQEYHMNSLGYHDIGYNFLIGSDGNVYEGAGWHKVGAHTRGWNTKGLGIAFIGDFSDKLPPQSSLNITKQLLKCGIDKGELTSRYKLVGHRQVISTSGPGTTLFLEITDWPNYVEDP